MDDVNKLAKALKYGDIAAFDELYQKTYNVVYFSVLSILKDRSLAEDITQDTYMRLLKNISRYEENNFIGYLVTMAKNLAFNEYTSRKRTTYSDIDLDFLSHFSLQSHIEIDLEHRDIIENALKVLDETERNVVIMHTIGGLSHKEIATVTEKPLGTITWLYAKAVKKMKATLKEG